MRRQISGPTDTLLRAAGVPTIMVDEAFDNLVSSKAAVVLRAHHPIVQHIRHTTDIDVVQISRKSRCLLIVIEQRGDCGPLWQYREHTPRNCTFACRGVLPATIGDALTGELLEKLVIPAVALTGTVIKNVDKTGDGWLRVDVKPPWHIF